ncbi:MAG: polysaccharide deacetylase family protein [Bacteroidota bacterium]
MRIYVIQRRQVTRSGLFFGLFVLAFMLALQVRGVERRLFGVKPGVMLDGKPVAGLLPAELTEIIKRMAVKYERQARNAMYFLETGQIIPEQQGITVDVAGTVRLVCAAKAQARLRPITRPVPPAITREYFTPVFRGAPDRPEAALAINVAWGEESLPAMLAILKQENVRATFFFVGDWARKFPEMVRETAAAGHEIGNHGLYHGQPRTLTREELSRMILENNTLLASIIGRQPPPLFAPPSGEFDQRTVGITAELGYRTILWTVDTIDWKRPSPDLIHARVVNKVENGAIILMHPTAPTVAALPGVIKALKEKGLKLVTVGELLRK